MSVRYLGLGGAGGRLQGGEAQRVSAGEAGWRLEERRRVSERTQTSLLAQQLLIRHRIDGAGTGTTDCSTRAGDQHERCVSKHSHSIRSVAAVLPV